MLTLLNDYIILLHCDYTFRVLSHRAAATISQCKTTQTCVAIRIDEQSAFESREEIHITTQVLNSGQFTINSNAWWKPPPDENKPRKRQLSEEQPSGNGVKKPKIEIPVTPMGQSVPSSPSVPGTPTLKMWGTSPEDKQQAALLLSTEVYWDLDIQTSAVIKHRGPSEVLPPHQSNYHNNQIDTCTNDPVAA
ncbi:hypothetical protein P7K49_014144 [Saguinus oedipus]|uniref:Uncharacterized protein n=1 Tax=Saguinus oedipus TaxID=9490 RepID=A0ABQ9VI11_SAGOE|nr:hypothetical protein P7K49_014144 [Saguinus oedipus]